MKLSYLAVALLALVLSPTLRAADAPSTSTGQALAANPEAQGRGPLGLTEEQFNALKALNATEQLAQKEASRKIRDLMGKLHDQVEDQAKDDAIAATLADLRSTKKELQATLEKNEEKRASILKPIQQAKALLHWGASAAQRPGAAPAR